MRKSDSSVDGRSVVQEKSFRFAVRIIGLHQELADRRKKFVLSRQVLGSGTSIGANVEEAEGAASRADFCNKMSLSYKEARETHYWLRLLFATGYVSEGFARPLLLECEELCKLLFSILRTPRLRLQKQP